MLIILLGLLAVTGFAQEANNGDEVLAELQGALEGDDPTIPKVDVALGSFKQNMAETVSKHTTIN